MNENICLYHEKLLERLSADLEFSAGAVEVEADVVRVKSRDFARRNCRDLEIPSLPLCRRLHRTT